MQIDILARAPSGTLTLVEVKMQTALGLAHLPREQRLRLARAASVLAQFEPVQLALALLEPGRLTLLPVDALTDF